MRQHTEGVNGELTDSTHKTLQRPNPYKHYTAWLREQVRSETCGHARDFQPLPMNTKGGARAAKNFTRLSLVLLYLRSRDRQSNLEPSMGLGTQKGPVYGEIAELTPKTAKTCRPVCSEAVRE